MPQKRKIPLDAMAEWAKKYQPKPKIAYKMMQRYVEKKYGFKVYTAYIAEKVLVRRINYLIMKKRIRLNILEK